mmetsp:Transcript_3339/g.5833  ORF Transcript_3339/g.5833 Transcript_3339/m.5833 type:complete len:241 (-) Transcript_3339:68-790(-)
MFMTRVGRPAQPVVRRLLLRRRDRRHVGVGEGHAYRHGERSLSQFVKLRDRNLVLRRSGTSLEGRLRRLEEGLHFLVAELAEEVVPRSGVLEGLPPELGRPGVVPLLVSELVRSVGPGTEVELVDEIVSDNGCPREEMRDVVERTVEDSQAAHLGIDREGRDPCDVGRAGSVPAVEDGGGPVDGLAGALVPRQVRLGSEIGNRGQDLVQRGRLGRPEGRGRGLGRSGPPCTGGRGGGWRG